MKNNQHFFIKIYISCYTSLTVVYYFLEHTLQITEGTGVYATDPIAICKAIATNTLCDGNNGQTKYLFPGSNCTKYYKCDDTNLIKGTCSHLNVFDPVRGDCVLKSHTTGNLSCYDRCDVESATGIPGKNPDG